MRGSGADSQCKATVGLRTGEVPCPDRWTDSERPEAGRGGRCPGRGEKVRWSSHGKESQPAG